LAVWEAKFNKKARRAVISEIERAKNWEGKNNSA
jgi:hypothetical protein